MSCALTQETPGLPAALLVFNTFRFHYIKKYCRFCDLSATYLPQSLAGLEMNSSGSFTSARTGHSPKASLPHIMAADDPERVGFLTLPRELRDNIYHNLVVAADPIQYDENFHTLSRSDIFAKTAMMWMFETGSNCQIAQETRETFYQHNTFLIYTHDIPKLLEAQTHAMSLELGEVAEPTIYNTRFEAGPWVRKLAVRVGWHASGGWSPDLCCLNPGKDLRVLLQWDNLRSVIIDAKFGAWSFGYPQGIGWRLLKKMNTKWGEQFKIYNDQTLSMDTRRYTSDRRDLSEMVEIFDHQDQSSEKSVEEEVRSEGGEQENIYDDEEVGLWQDVELGSEDARSEEGEEEEELEEEHLEEEELEEEELEEEEAAHSGTSEEETEEEADEREEEGWSGDDAEPDKGHNQDEEDHRSG